jgi:uncharacterized ferritin-like protein (DUF455 family)
MNFYATLEQLLEIANPLEKIENFKVFYTAYRKGECVKEVAHPVCIFQKPSYASFCTIVDPQRVPRRKNLATLEGKITMLHAIAHIEYSAIDLALDAAYRFRDLPDAFYDDWLEVADDEIRHFQMIEALLRELGSYYGALEVHEALFEASNRTAHSLLHRMAVVPRYLEAGGLDANPQILRRLETLKEDAMCARMIDALELILQEEIDHVRKGDCWFELACKRENLERSVYFDIIQYYYPDTLERQRNLNTTARLEAGFTCNELERLAHERVC